MSIEYFLSYKKTLKVCIRCGLLLLSGCGIPDTSRVGEAVTVQREDVQAEEKMVMAQPEQEIEAYMEDFVSSYMSEICGGDQKILMQTKDIYVDDFGYPVELTVYRNDKEEDIRYQIQLYGETGRSVTDYYLCEHFIYVNEEKEYYSSQILTENYNDVLYRKTTDWIILEDEIYLLLDSGEMEIEDDAPFYSIEEVKGWTAETEE